MRLKTIRERAEQLKNDLNITAHESMTLFKLLKNKNASDFKPINYFKLKQFSDGALMPFEDIKNLYLKWLNFRAKQLNKKVLHGLIIKPNITNGKLYINQIDFIDDLETYYNLIICDNIDIQERKINGKIYDFIIDDEYMLKEDKNTIERISAIERTQNEILYNRFMILGQADENGQETSLNEEDINNILKSRAYINIGTDEQPKEKIILIYNF